MKHIIACVEAMKEVLGDEVGLALDCGPGWTVPDAIRFARAVEHLNLMWLEDMITGDYVPYVNADVYREVTRATSTPIHTGEQIYLRQNFKELIERHAVNIIGPDPCDVGGIAELKWIAEYADLHGILIAPHGTGNGLLGLAALVQVSATLPHNFIAFEYPIGDPAWWYDIVDGLPDPIVKNGMIDVWDRPGMGVELNPEKAKRYLVGRGRGVLRLSVPHGRRSRMIQTNDITRPPREWVEALQHDRRRDREQHAQQDGHPQRAYLRPDGAHRRQGDRRAGADAAVHAEARGPLRRGRIRRAGEAAAPPRPLSHAARRHRGGGRARRHEERRLRRHDAHLLQGEGRDRRRRRRMPSRLPEHQEARSRAVDLRA